MMKKKQLFYIFVLLNLLLIGDGFCDIHVSGNVSGTWTADESPYFADAELIVGQDDTLKIEPGVSVIFFGRFGFTISGLLFAEGTVDDTIYFYARDAQHDAWLGLTFNTIRSSGSTFNYCSVRHGRRGISLDGSSPTISHCRLAHHEANGIRFSESDAVVRYCNIFDIHEDGILVENNARPRIEGCFISDCLDQGIWVRENSGVFAISDTIRNVSDHGIVLTEAAACSLAYCLITDVELRGIHVNQTNTAILFRNIVDGTGQEAIWIYRSEDIEVINCDAMNSVMSGIRMFNSNVDVINNILIRNGGNGIEVQDSVVRLFNNCVWDNEGGDYDGINQGDTDINASPDLGGNYIPNDNSVVIDAGDRRYNDPDGTTADIGARFFNQNHPPEIVSATPEPFDELVGDQDIEFTVYAEDDDDNELTYTWYVNDVIVANVYSTTISFNRDGEYVVKIAVSYTHLRAHET